MIKKIISVICAVSALICSSACGGDNAVKSDKLQVYTSFYAMYDFAKMIGGDKADIYNMCPTGSEPHDFEPTAKDMASLTEADVFIYNGLGMEPWTASAITALDGTDVTIVEASKNAPNISENYDPHVWLDPENAFAQLSAITNALCESDPQNSDYYAARLEECRAKTDTLINDYKTAIQGFTSRNIVTSHDAYMNLCNAFALVSLPINSVAADEPTPTRVAEVEEFIKANNIKYVFTEPLSSSSVAESIASDTGCDILILNPFEGSLDEKDYFTVMYENLESLKKALS